MRDFADVPNSVGSFPDVTAQDCSGPGTTDGTAIIADTMTDYWGAIQALLNDQGLTPNDSAESSTDSQILQAIKLLIIPKIFHPGLWIPAWDSGGNPDWQFNPSTNRMESMVNSGEMILPIRFPIGTLDTEFTIRVSPGAARSGGDRIAVALWYQTQTGSVTQIGSTVYDDGTANLQNIVATNNSIAITSDRIYWLRLKAGNDAASNIDDVRPVTLDISFN